MTPRSPPPAGNEVPARQYLPNSLNYPAIAPNSHRAQESSSSAQPDYATIMQYYGTPMQYPYSLQSDLRTSPSSVPRSLTQPSTLTEASFTRSVPSTDPSQLRLHPPAAYPPMPGMNTSGTVYPWEAQSRLPYSSTPVANTSVQQDAYGSALRPTDQRPDYPPLEYQPQGIRVNGPVYSVYRQPAGSPSLTSTPTMSADGYVYQTPQRGNRPVYSRSL